MFTFKDDRHILMKDVEPIYIPNYMEMLVRYYSDQHCGYRYDDKLFNNDFTLISSVRHDIYNRNLNVTKHIPITFYCKKSLVYSFIEINGLNAVPELFNVLKATEYRLHDDLYITNLTLFEILNMMRIIKPGDNNYAQYVDILTIFPDDFYYELLSDPESTIGSTKGKSKLKVPTHSTYESDEDILIIDDLTELDKSLSKNSNMSELLLSKLYTITVRIKLPKCYDVEFMNIIKYYLDSRSGRMSVVTNTSDPEKAKNSDDKYLYLTCNLSDYSLIFNNWEAFIENDNLLIPFLYYCLNINTESCLGSILKIKNRKSENRLYNLLVNDDKSRGKFHV